MPKSTVEGTEKNAIWLRLGGWFEVRGTGWGVWAIPLVLLALGLAACARAFLGSLSQVP